MSYSKTGFLQIFWLVLLINPLSQALHEGGHWLVCQALGLDPVWGFIGLVQVWGQPPLQPEQWVETRSSDGEIGWLALGSRPVGFGAFVAAAGGPLASLLGLWAGLLIERLCHRPGLRRAGLLLALTAGFAMTMYYLRSPWRSGGDESEMAAYLGLSKAWLELALAALAVSGFVWALRRLGDWRTAARWLAAVFLGSVLTGLALSLLDGLVRSQYSQANPLFRPVFGYSLPVLLLNSLVLLGLALALYRQREQGRTGGSSKKNTL